MSCTKTTIIDRLTEQVGLTPFEAKNSVEQLIEIMKSTLVSGEDILITGFGKFQVKEKAPRKGRNPATGETMILEKRRVVTFKCNGKLRDKINSER